MQETRGKKQKKIMFIIDEIVNPQAGTENQLLALINCLPQPDFGLYLCVLKHSNWLSTARLPCKMYIVNYKGMLKFSSIIQLMKLANFIRREKIGLVQTFFIEGNIFGTCAAKLARVKYIFSCRRNLGHWQDRTNLRILRILNCFTTHIVANSYNVACRVVQSESVPWDKVSIIYNGVDLTRFQPNLKLENAGVRFMVGIVANLKIIKGINHFIGAAKFILEQFPQTEFEIVGDGPEKNDLIALAEELGLLDSINFIGESSEVEKYLCNWDVAVSSSLTEGLSNSILEYMACGIPVVATHVGGTPELIEDNVNGFIVPPGNSELLAKAVIKLFRDDKLRGRMGKLNRQKVIQNFSLAIMQQKYIDFYNKLLI